MILAAARLAGCALAMLTLAIGGPAAAADHDRWAALATPIFATYGQDAGLPNPVTTAIAESDDGFLWVGTEGGLARWDGYHFRVYRPRQGDEHALPDAWVTTLTTDRHGRLWVGTNAGGLARYDRDADRFVTYGAGRGRLSDVHVTAVADDGSGGVWVGSEGGLDHVDPIRDRITAIHHHVPARAGGLPDDHIVTILRDRGGTLWVGTLHGLARTRDGRRFETVPLGDARQPLIISALFGDDTGRIWIGTQNDGAFRVDADGVPPRPVRESHGAGHEWINAIDQADRDHVWLGTYGQGIVVVDTASGQTHRIARDRVVPQSLTNDSVWSIHRDRAGDMWVGTDVGLSCLTARSADAVSTVFGNTSNSRGLRGEDVTAVMAASNGAVWAGERTQGVDIFDPLRGRIAAIASDRRRPDRALPAAGIQSIVEWTPGTTYVGGMFGLYRVDASRHVSRVVLPGRDRIVQLSAISRQAGSLWIASRGNGIWTTVPGSRDVAPIGSVGLVDTRGTVFARGSGDDLWVGTRNGLERIDLRTRRVERIPPGTGSTELAAGYVCTLVLDREGRLWVGTADGIEVLMGRVRGRPVFHRIGLDQGLPDADIDALLRDDAGRMWAATDNGIAVIDPKTFSVRSLHRADGVAISGYWSGSGARTSAGELIFGGQGGLTIVRPELYRAWDYHPPIVVTQALVGGEPVRATRFNRAGDRAAAPEPLRIDSGANSLSVEFAALDYSEPSHNRYAYRLDGFDRDWIASDATKRLAAYTNLPPGDYTLRLRGSNREGAWSETTLDLPIRVKPAWYQTMLFRIALGVLAALAVATLIRLRTRYLERRQRELERQVETRTAELEESNRQVERLAYHDALTGLPNRRLFNDDLQHRVAAMERLGRPFALVLIDLDRFKETNDRLGHDAGDALLIEASKRLRGSLRVTDRLARIGGDEFAAILDDFSGDEGHGRERDAVAAICARILEGFVEPIVFREHAMKSSASVGVAFAPEHGTHADAIFKASDLALYEAKRGGRDTWRWYVPGAAASPGDAARTGSGRTAVPR